MPHVPMSGALAGRGVVITRPSGQAGRLAALVQDAGGRPILFPALEILDVADVAPLNEVFDRLEEFQLAVFVSPNAVHKALGLARERRGARPWPRRLMLAAIGRGSRRELEGQGLSAIVAPGARADSESLLALPQLRDVAGKRVVIFRGEGGRELLGEALAARGALVTHAVCYRRSRPDADAGPLLAAWSRGEVHAVTVASGETLANLSAMLGKAGEERLRSAPLFVAHERIAAQAERRGLAGARVAGPGDEDMLAALVAYFGAAK